MPAESGLNATVDFINKIAKVNTVLTGRGGKYAQAAGMLGSIGEDFQKRQENSDILKAKRDIAAGQINDVMLDESRGYAGTVYNNRFNQSFIGIKEAFAQGQYDSKSATEVNDMMTRTYNELAQKTEDPQALNILTRQFDSHQASIQNLHGKRHLAWQKAEWEREGSIAINQHMQIWRGNEAEGGTGVVAGEIRSLEQLREIIGVKNIAKNDEIAANAFLAAATDGDTNSMRGFDLLPLTSDTIMKREQAERALQTLELKNFNAEVALIHADVQEGITQGTFGPHNIASYLKRLPPGTNLGTNAQIGRWYNESRKNAMNLKMINDGMLAAESGSSLPIGITSAQTKKVMIGAVDKLMNNEQLHGGQRAAAFARMADVYGKAATTEIGNVLQTALGFTGRFDKRTGEGMPEKRIAAVEALVFMSEYGSKPRINAMAGPYAPMIDSVTQYLKSNPGDTEAAIIEWEKKTELMEKIKTVDPEVVKNVTDRVENYVRDVKDYHGFYDMLKSTPQFGASFKVTVGKYAKEMLALNPGLGVDPEAVGRMAVSKAMNEYEELSPGKYTYSKGGNSIETSLHDAGMPQTMKTKDFVQYAQEHFVVHNNSTGETENLGDITWSVNGDSFVLTDADYDQLALPMDKIVALYNFTQQMDLKTQAAMEADESSLHKTRLVEYIDQERDQMEEILMDRDEGKIQANEIKARKFAELQKEFQLKNNTKEPLTLGMWHSLGRGDQRKMLMASTDTLGRKFQLGFQDIMNKFRESKQDPAVEAYRNTNIAYQKLMINSPEFGEMGLGINDNFIPETSPRAEGKGYEEVRSRREAATIAEEGRAVKQEEREGLQILGTETVR